MSPRCFNLFSCPVLLFNWYHLIKWFICLFRMNYFLEKFDTKSDTLLWVIGKRRNSTRASWQFPKIHLQWNFDEKLSVWHLLYFPGREWNCGKEKTEEFSRWYVIFWRFFYSSHSSFHSTLGPDLSFTEVLDFSLPNLITTKESLHPTVIVEQCEKSNVKSWRNSTFPHFFRATYRFFLWSASFSLCPLKKK